MSLLALAGYALHQEEPGGAIEDLLAFRGEPAGEAAVLAGEALIDMGPRTVDRPLRDRVVQALPGPCEGGSPRRPGAGGIRAIRATRTSSPIG